MQSNAVAINWSQTTWYIIAVNYLHTYIRALKPSFLGIKNSCQPWNKTKGSFSLRTALRIWLNLTSAPTGRQAGSTHKHTHLNVHYVGLSCCPLKDLDQTPLPSTPPPPTPNEHWKCNKDKLTVVVKCIALVSSASHITHHYNGIVTKLNIPPVRTTALQRHDTCWLH